MPTATTVSASDAPRESYTFVDGQTVPFRVTVPPMPSPVQLIAYGHPHDQIAACVPRILTSVPPGRLARFMAHVHELECIHGQPAIVRETREGSQMIYCPDCRRHASLDLAAPALASELKEREARRRYRDNGAEGVG